VECGWSSSSGRFSVVPLMDDLGGGFSVVPLMDDLGGVHVPNCMHTVSALAPFRPPTRTDLLA
jgi:hypothetical protein